MKKEIRKPKMIFFDYGNTLLNEPDFDPVRGDKALAQYIIHNPQRVTPDQISDCARRVFQATEPAREQGFEVHEHALLRLVNDLLQLEYSISIQEQEMVFWDHASSAVPLPHVVQMLEELHKNGIRTAVISNISFSERALKQKIDRFLPGNHFEFVVASSEYGVRKPNPMIFQTALQRANVASEDAWFCGDRFDADVLGASKSGIFPVWYLGGVRLENHVDEIPQKPERLMITDWQELTNALGICSSNDCNE